MTSPKPVIPHGSRMKESFLCAGDKGKNTAQEVKIELIDLWLCRKREARKVSTN